jgi:hypothetical protein
MITLDDLKSRLQSCGFTEEEYLDPPAAAILSVLFEQNDIIQGFSDRIEKLTREINFYTAALKKISRQLEEELQRPKVGGH